MSEKEQVLILLEKVPDYKMGYILAYIQGITADENNDDEFCSNLYNEYLSDPDKDESYSLEDCMKEWGLINVSPSC